MPSMVVIDVYAGPFGGHVVVLELGGVAEDWPTRPVDREKIVVAEAGS